MCQRERECAHTFQFSMHAHARTCVWRVEIAKDAKANQEGESKINITRKWGRILWTRALRESIAQIYIAIHGFISISIFQLLVKEKKKDPFNIVIWFSDGFYIIFISFSDLLLLLLLVGCWYYCFKLFFVLFNNSDRTIRLNCMIYAYKTEIQMYFTCGPWHKAYEVRWTLNIIKEVVKKISNDLLVAISIL